jgi:hypothetical protein
MFAISQKSLSATSIQNQIRLLKTYQMKNVLHLGWHKKVKSYYEKPFFLLVKKA